MAIYLTNGDVLKAPQHIIAHQVNTLGIMGAGLALQIKEKYPEIFNKYREICKSHTPGELLGTCHTWITRDGKLIANIFAQSSIGRGAVRTDYKALEEGFGRIAEIMEIDNLSLALPYGIGCGLAGGNWKIVEDLIVRIFGSLEQNTFIYKLLDDKS